MKKRKKLELTKKEVKLLDAWYDFIDSNYLIRNSDYNLKQKITSYLSKSK